MIITLGSVLFKSGCEPTSLGIGGVALTDGIGIHCSSKCPKHATAAAPHGRLVCFNTVSIPVQEDN